MPPIAGLISGTLSLVVGEYGDKTPIWVNRQTSGTTTCAVAQATNTGFSVIGRLRDFVLSAATLGSAEALVNVASRLDVVLGALSFVGNLAQALVANIVPMSSFAGRCADTGENWYRTMSREPSFHDPMMFWNRKGDETVPFGSAAGMFLDPNGFPLGSNVVLSQYANVDHVGLMYDSRTQMAILSGLEVECRRAARDPFRKAERMRDRNPHVRIAELGDNRAVGIFDHGMNNALGMDDDFDAFARGIEQPMRLDHFEALVHQRGRIHRDLLPHLPRGMTTVSYTHLRAHETVLDLVCRLLLEKKKYIY